MISCAGYWDEDHRMLASGNSLHNGFYFYNGEGERTYKLSGMTRSMNINGQPQTYEILDRATLYVSPYLVASERGASKHIYAGTERIASHPVNSAINGLNSDELSDEELMAKLNAQIDMMLEVYLNYLPGENQSLNMTWDMLAHLRSTGQSMPKDEIYYYHTDHLGSSSWITYTDGSPVQYLSYLPFGEPQIDQRSGDWNSRYTFSGKERDEETGYSYFGARYYDPDISIWLSRDPLADKYPYQSPYVYCGNNPLRIIDPDGRDEYEFDKQGNFLRRTESEKDNLIIVSGDKRTVSRDFDKGTFDKYFTNGSDGKDADGNTAMDGLSKSDALGAFNFMGDNTSVEWGYMESLDASGNSSFLIGTAHDEDGESFVFNQAKKITSGSLIKYDHSHKFDGTNIINGGNPSTKETSSNSNKFSDVEAWGDLLKIHPNATMGIRFKGRAINHIDKGIPQNNIRKHFQK